MLLLLVLLLLRTRALSALSLLPGFPHLGEPSRVLPSRFCAPSKTCGCNLR